MSDVDTLINGTSIRLRRVVSCLLQVSALLAVLLHSSTAAAETFTLRNAAQAITWSGAATGGVGHLTEVPECASGCDRIDLRLSLPRGVWMNRPGGVQIALRWQGGIFGDNLKLFVYRGTSLIARSDGIIAISQGVLIPAPENGLLRIYVAYDPDSTSNPLAYDGLAEVEYEPRVHPTRRLLPDLEARPQEHLSFDPGGIFFDTISTDFPTCYQSEVDEEAARLCLRFDQIFANSGEGPMELRFSVPTGTTPPTTDVFQRIVWSDDPDHADSQLVGQVEFHEIHGHFHFTSFGQSRLFRATRTGQRASVVPIRQRHTRRTRPLTLVRSGRKVSFCLADTLVDQWAKKGDGPRTYMAPDCLLPASTDGVSDFYVQGITRGWADIYDFYLPDQYIDVFGLPDGDYVMETEADPDRVLTERTRANNCTSILIRLVGLATSNPSVTALGPGPACQP